MMSRNESPSLTSSSDLALVIPMLVPRPPFSFSTSAASSASRGAVGIVGQLLRVRQRLDRLDLGLGQRALLPLLEARPLAR